MNTADATPLVSVVMANHNGAAHIAAAVRSVLRQSEPSLELILSDDGSDDDSLARASEAASGDPRLIVVKGKRGGPGAARNRALKRARGRWIAIIDSDDFIHSNRLARLIAAAEADGADIVADDLITFYPGGEREAHAHLAGALARAPRWISPELYLAANHLFSDVPSLGYLKPVFRRALIKGGARYDESLAIAEDFDLVARLLVGGARMRTYPDLGYFYRKHAASISHRLNLAQIDAMLAAHDRLGEGRDLAAALKAALDARRASLLDARAFTELVAALKQRDAKRAVSIALNRPAALWLLYVPLRDRLFRRAPAPRTPGPPRIALLSRQRLLGATNGSSAYLISLAQALRAAGYAVDFIGASPKLFGRWPAFKLKPETEAFASYRVHGAVHIDDMIVAADPRVGLAALATMADKALKRLGLPSPGWDAPAEYAQGAAATREDMLYVARCAHPDTRAVLCDYAFLAPLAPYALAPEAPSLIIMHDFMSARVGDADSEAAPDAVIGLSRDAELALLAQADAIVAIQAEEAAAVRAALPEATVLVAPHAVAPVAKAQPGQDDLVLFVGSNTAPNVVGLRRFFERCWPRIYAWRPNTRLIVAGSVARAFTEAPPGVRMLGVVPDLTSLYRDAGVVISPLHTGSGLKVKLIEALAAGKAVVGTSVTTQGVAALTQGALAKTDDPDRFAETVILLLGDPATREQLGRSALVATRAHFSSRTSSAELLAYLRGGASAAGAAASPSAVLSQ